MSAAGQACRGPLAAMLLLLAGPAAASLDEAWLARAPLPRDVRPLLVLLDHASQDGTSSVMLAGPYDPALDYAARVAADEACDPARVYWRRGPGPAPDCATAASVPLEGSARAGFRCEAGRDPLARHGLFVSSRAAQWQDAPGGGGWRELRAGSEAAIECRADRGLHGAAPGAWYAAAGDAGPWSDDALAEIDWDAAPLSDAYVFFSGNYLNYRAAATPTGPVPLAAAFAAAAATAAAVTEGLDLALARPAGDEVTLILPPTKLPAAGPVAEALAMPAVGAEMDAETSVAALTRWLAGDPRGFTHACRPVTAALVAQSTAATCVDGTCLAAEIAALTLPDLVAGLADVQRSRAWVVTAAPPAEAVVAAAHATGTRLLDLGDPLALPMLFAHALQHDAGRPAAERLSSPATALAGFGLHVGESFHGVSSPAARRRWPGSLRKRELGAARGTDLFDAASRLPPPDSRRWYSDLLTPELLSREGSLDVALASQSRGALGLSSHDAVTGADLLAWARGVDALDQDADGDRSEPRRELGDPGLEPPVLVRYGTDPARTLLFAATADGTLHAIDATTGGEAWAWLPAASHASLRALADPAETRVRLPRGSGLRLQQLDLDGDGAIDAAAGERARLLLGYGAGARGYAALDVSDPTRPRLAWSLDAAGLPGLGETFVAPVPARMRIDADRQRGDWRVAILTGGYDPLQRARGAAADAVGGRLVIVGSASGLPLWQAAAEAGPGVDIAHPELTASFAAPPRAVDADGDGLAERLYALDVAGRLWRFDFEGTGPSVRLLARLGTSAAPAGGGEARRFHAAPDVVYLRGGPTPRLALAFGSGWAERPHDRSITDRFYVVFDGLGADAAATDPLGEDDLADVTTGTVPPAGAPGWFYRLSAHGAGEKAWGASLTLGHRLWFTTFQPLPPDPASPCGPPRGIGRLYTLAIANGLPLGYVEESPQPSVELPGEAPPPPLRLALPVDEGEACAGGACRGELLLVIGEQALPTGFRNLPVKTSWRRLETAE